jgi:hypothetical protein
MGQEQVKFVEGMVMTKNKRPKKKWHGDATCIGKEERERERIAGRGAGAGEDR